jgi:hypothetical protein
MKSSRINYLVSHSAIFFKVILYEHFIVNNIFFLIPLACFGFYYCYFPLETWWQVFFNYFFGALCEWDVWNVYMVIYFVIDYVTEAKCAWIMWWLERHIAFWKFVLGNDSFSSVKFRLFLLVVLLAVLILWS